MEKPLSGGLVEANLDDPEVGPAELGHETRSGLGDVVVHEVHCAAMVGNDRHGRAARPSAGREEATVSADREAMAR